MKDKNTLREDARILGASIRLLGELDRTYLPAVIGHSLLETARYFLALVLSARILDELMGAREMGRLTLLAAILVGGGFGLKLASDALERIRRAKGRTLSHRINFRISEKILTLDYEYMDNPVLHDLRQKILEYDNMNGSISTFAAQLADTVTSLIQIGASVFFAVALFAPGTAAGGSGLAAVMNSPLWAVGVAAAMAAMVWVQMRSSRQYGAFQMEIFNGMMGINRIGIYMMFTLCGDYRNGKDLRMYDTQALVGGIQNRFVSDLRGYLLKMARRKTAVEGRGSLAGGIFIGLIYLFVVVKAYVGAVTIGSVMKYVGAIQKLSAGISGLFVGLTELRVSCHFMNHIHELINLPDIKYHGTLPVEKRDDHEYEIEFRHVSFRYPGGNEDVLRDISMKLNISERLAVVGMNGAGKTTFIKLLCRLYDPTQGEILLNGIDIRKYDYREYLSLFSVVFQDFRIFSFPADENVAASLRPDPEKVADSLEKAGLSERMRSLPLGPGTPVGKSFDEQGVDFSGGETQKLAIARALYKDAHIIILDEPTASLDPLSEFEIYSRFNSLVGGKTAVYISHRLSSCRFCHDIIVFHEGRIHQRGSHGELMEDAEGLYRRMWQAQARYYREQPGEAGEMPTG